MPSFHLLSREELDTAIQWAKAEGWNPGLADGDAFWAADPKGFWGMWEGDVLIGTASTVVYEGRLGFVGLFIVRPEWRNKGLGTQFWNHFIGQLKERIGPGGGAALDGVFDMQPYYAKSGFQFTHRNLRMQGVGQEAPVAEAIAGAETVDFAALLHYDQRHFGAPRPEFLQRWIYPPGKGRALVWKQGEQIRGFGAIRPCHHGFKIGPLFADTPEIAEALFLALNRQAVGEPIFLDVPECNEAAMALSARYNMTSQFGCARMVMGHFPQLPWENIFGVTTFELG